MNGESRDYRALERTFARAVRAQAQGQDDRAFELFKKVLAAEPRLPEARLEVAMILLRKDRIDEAEAQAREALEQVEKGWRALDAWTDDQLLAHACNLVVECIKARLAGEESFSLGPEALQDLWEEARRLVERAAALDPDNPDVMHNYYGFRAARAGRGAARVQD